MLSKIESKLLIVDDLADNLLALEALIAGPSRQVFKAYSAEQALALLLDHEFALAILDVQMPGMDGFELAELMRGTEKTKDIPIVFVSAAGRERNYAFKGYEHGAVDFLHKPLDTHAVRTKVSVFVELYRQRKALSIQLQALERGRREQEALLDELRNTQSELQRAVTMRDEFMSIVSHELRTPLNGLILETQLRKLQLGKGNMDAFSLDKLKAMNARDERQIMSLIRLIEDMLDISRISTGRLSIRPAQFDLSQLVRNVVENFSTRFALSQCSISLDADQAVLGCWDEFRVEQVITNLLTNAMRYGRGEPVHIRVYADQDAAYIAVRDHGIGIKEEDQQRIFLQFERASDSAVMSGLGLGLYISEQIVRAHQGCIRLQSTPGEGSCFEVVLPLRSAAVSS
jgi:signal transduction histidine kinase